jgi:AraC-like DNA-binding protein
MQRGEDLLYQQVPPGGRLAPYVECFWLLKAPADRLPKRERRLADGCVDVVFHFAGAYRHAPPDGLASTPALRRSAVLGQRTRGYVIEPGGDTSCVAIRFRPGGLAAFTPLPLHELTDRAVELDRLWGPDVAAWEERLVTAPSLAQAGAVLARLLRARFADRPHLRAIRAAVRQIDAAGGDVSMRALADGFGWSQKHLERLFAQQVGLTPKRYARIARFRRLSRFAARAHPDRTMGWLAADFGYYDQSHLVREVTSLAGVAPREFFALWCPICRGAPLHLQGCPQRRR